MLACSLSILSQTVNNTKMKDVKNAVESFPFANINHEPTPSDKITSDFNNNNSYKIEDGLCKNCDYNGSCVWQHNNKLFCEHFN